MGILKAILAALSGFFGFASAREKNLPTRELNQLDEEAASLRLQMRVAADGGNTVLLSELQTRLGANYARSKALRSTQSHESGKGH